MLVKIHNTMNNCYISNENIDCNYSKYRRTGFISHIFNGWVILDNLHSLLLLIMDIEKYKWNCFELIICNLTYGEENDYRVPNKNLETNISIIKFN